MLPLNLFLKVQFHLIAEFLFYFVRSKHDGAINANSSNTKQLMDPSVFLKIQMLLLQKFYNRLENSISEAFQVTIPGFIQFGNISYAILIRAKISLAVLNLFAHINIFLSILVIAYHKQYTV